MTQATRRIVIIGAGIAGLCAAVYARKCGYEVEVFERHETAGGLATSWRRGDYTFETCLHWLVGSNPAGSLHTQWREVFDIDKLTFVDPDVFIRVETEQGGVLSIYADVDRLEAELLKRCPQDATEIRRLTSSVRRLASFEMPEPGARGLRRWLLLLGAVPYLPLLRRWSRIDLDAYGKRFNDPLLRSFLGGGGISHLSALALVFSLAWMSGRNAGYAIGGSQAVIRAIVERLSELGGHLRLGTAVERIVVEEGVAVGARLTSGDTVMADWVISAADGHSTIYDMLGGKFTDEATDKAYATLETFPSYLQVSLGVGRDLSHKAAHVLRLLDTPLTVDPGTELRELDFRFFHFDPTFAPQGKTAVTCFLPTYNFEHWVDLREDEPARYQAEKRRVSEAVVDVLERDIPGIRDAIEVSDVSTPASVIRYTANWKGSMEGWLMTPRTGFRSLPMALPGLSHFSMIGQWVRPGGGLPSGLMTARTAIEAICKGDRKRFLA